MAPALKVPAARHRRSYQPTLALGPRILTGSDSRPSANERARIASNGACVVVANETGRLSLDGAHARRWPVSQ